MRATRRNGQHTVRYFYDTEFIEDGETITLISIGIVAEDGREYYACSTEFNPNSACQWVKDHVLNQLPGPASKTWKNNETIRAEVQAFLSAGKSHERHELWAWCGAYDHVVLAQLWGDMSALPRHVPHFTRELKQYWFMAGCPKLPPQPTGHHDALVDARHNLAKFKICQERLPLKPGGAVDLRALANRPTTG